MTAKKLGTIASVVGLAIGSAAGAFGHSRATAREPEQEQRTVSAPSVTTADIAALRTYLDGKFEVQGQRIGAVEQGLAGVNGYLKAQEQARRR